MHTILVVEDEKELRELISEALEMHGYNVVTATEGKTALAAIPKIEKLCLVLLDLLMPGMNGWDLFAAIRAQPQLASVPVIVHTSSPDAAPAGATSVLRKPTELTRLLEVVGRYCDKQPTA